MAIADPINLDDLEGMKLKREKDDMYDAAIDTDFSKGAESLMEGLNMTEFNKDRENDAKVQIAGLETEEGDPEDLLAELDAAEGGESEMQFNDPEISEDEKGVDPKLYNPDTYSGQIRTRMAERFDTESGGNAEILEAQLSTPEGREQNTKQIDDLFFGDAALERSLSLLPKGEQEENQNWFEANMSEGGPLENSFERIKGNFVLPPELQNKQLNEIHKENPDNLKIVNNALADAILLEVANHTTQGKVNYSEVAVKVLIHEIKDINTSATEKIRKFGEIHSIVNTGIAKGTKQDKAYRERLLAGKAAEQENRTFYITQAETARNNSNQNTPQNTQESKTDINEIQGGDIFPAGQLDRNRTSSQNPTETA